ncbi:succinate dehydrogenase, cytochrome b556 subunit [Devosia sp. ZB163]|uniref:succinate dehydrogenase, cytochrome b556 subunit n=1 Tax=Devosia sp. ZB163 TaxID=3025938 RepID=UPI0023626D74|nr:succinate dehydrogenase, cytochrome b556 subunit [Devosia sp. ZB163]MDC9822153.1 succinate dehydrogenase, cytochrome b556 subunit [Devosia sp. ZB163]
MAPSSRPLSPHLSIYGFTLTMTMSIVHRATGIALYGGTLLLVLWLVAAATGGGFFNFVTWLFGTWFGQLVLFGYTWVLFHHMLGGVRHFVWDMAKAMDPVGRELAVRIQLGASILLTLIVWAIFVWFK